MSAEVLREPRTESATGQPRHGGLISKLLGVLLFSLFLSIVMEWVGIGCFWPQEGALHSARMVDAEIAYLNADFTRGLLENNPSRQIQSLAAQAYYWLFHFTHLEDALRARAVDLPAPFWVYPPALGTADGVTGAVTVEVAQVSARFGPGAFARADLTL